MRAPLRLLPALLALAVTASACAGVLGATSGAVQPATEPTATATPTVEAEEPLASSLVWTPCDAPFECSTLRVPVDHADPGGTTLDLALIRLPAPPAARRIGSLVVNPGGPGGSGVEFVRAAAVQTIPAELRARFDIVGFDPRGVGGSAGISCGQDAVASFAANLTAATAQVLQTAREFADACRDHAGPLLPHVATANVVADLDLLRQALGDRRLTYLGYSYGTFIGAQYAERYPDQVRALVLDGAVDPAKDVVARARDKAAVSDAAMLDFLQWCRDDIRCPLHTTGQDPAVVVDQVLASLSRAPMAAPLLPGRPLTRGAALLSTSLLLNDRGDGWPALATGLAMMAQEGDASLLASVFHAISGRDAADSDTGTLAFAQLMAVNCLDLPAPPPEAYPTLVEEFETISPLFGLVTLLSWSPCSYWPVPASGAAAPIAAPDSPPLVVIGTVNDAVTPYGWAEAMADQLDQAVLFTRDGDTHTAFGGGNVCTDRAIMGYLLEERPPQAEMSCG